MNQLNLKFLGSKHVQGVYFGMTTATFLGYCICSIKKKKDFGWKELGKVFLTSLLKSTIWPITLPYDVYRCIDSNYHSSSKSNFESNFAV